MLYTGMYWYVHGTYWWLTRYVLDILVCTWYVHGTSMLVYKNMSFSTWPPKYAIFSVYSWYLLSCTSGHDPSEFSFLKLWAIGTWSWLVSTQFMSVHTAHNSRKLNSLGSWPDVQVSRYQEYTENLAYFGGPVLYDIISYHSIVLPCICMWV